MSLWRWLPVTLGSGRRVYHLAQQYWPMTADEPSWAVFCSRPDSDVTRVDKEGRVWCVLCDRKAISP